MFNVINQFGLNNSHNTDHPNIILNNQVFEDDFDFNNVRIDCFIKYSKLNDLN